MALQRVVVEITGSPKELDSTINKLEQLGKVDKANAEQFNKSHETFKKQTKEKEGILGDFEHGTQNRFKRITEYIVAAFAVERIKDFTTEAIKAFSEAEQSAKRLEFAITKVNGGGKKAFDELIEQSEELSKSLNRLFTPKQIQDVQLQLANFGLTKDMIKKLTPAILDMSKATGHDLSDSTQKAILAINGQTKGLRDVGISFKDTGSKTENYNKLLKDMSKFSGEANDATKTTSGQLEAMSNEWDLLKESVGKFLVDNHIVEFFYNLAKSIGFALKSEKELREEVDKQTMSKAFQEDVNQINEEVVRLGHLMEKAGKNHQQIAVETEKFLVREIKRLGALGKDTDQLMDHYFHKEQKLADDATLAGEQRHKKELKEIKDFTDHYWDMVLSGMKEGREKELTQEDIAQGKRLEGLDKELKEDIKLNDENLKNKLISQKEHDKESEKLYAAFNKQFQYLTEENRNKIAEINRKWDEKEKEEFYNAKVKSLEDQRILEQDALKQRLADKLITQKQYDKLALQDEIANDEELLKLQEEHGDDTTALQVKINEEKRKLREQDLKDQKEAMQEAIKDLKDFAQFIIENLQTQSEAVQKANDYRISQQDSLIQTQRTLAEAGLKNDLAFEEKRRAMLEAQNIREVQKQKHFKELMILLNSIEEFSKTDPKTAVSKALVLMGTVKGAEAIFAEEGGLIGTNDRKSLIGAWGSSIRHKSGNDVLVQAEKGEMILPKMAVQNLGINPGNYKSFISMLNNPGKAVIVNTTGIEEAVERAISKLPIQTIDIDKQGQIIETIIKNKVTTRTIHKF